MIPAQSSFPRRNPKRAQQMIRPCRVPGAPRRQADHGIRHSLWKPRNLWKAQVLGPRMKGTADKPRESRLRDAKRARLKSKSAAATEVQPHTRAKVRLPNGGRGV